MHSCCFLLQSVLVHQLSRFATQNPFRKNRGRVMRVAFHPTKPFFFVATQNAVRIYNLAKQVSQGIQKNSSVVLCSAASTAAAAAVQRWWYGMGYSFTMVATHNSVCILNLAKQVSRQRFHGCTAPSLVANYYVYCIAP